MAYLRDGTDLACALVCGAYIENATGALLEACMIDDPKANGPNGLLNDPKGILSTASARADMCFCLGFIGATTHNNAKGIAGIRNLFAHSHVPLDFDNEHIRAACNELHVALADPGSARRTPGNALGVLSGQHRPLPSLDRETTERVLSFPRQRFVLATCWTLFGLRYATVTDSGQTPIRVRKRPVPPSGEWLLKTHTADGELLFETVVLLVE